MFGQINVVVARGFRFGHFAFELGGFPANGNTLRITAVVASSGLSKSVDLTVTA
jgi:hypothetical protein